MAARKARMGTGGPTSLGKSQLLSSTPSLCTISLGTIQPKTQHKIVRNTYVMYFASRQNKKWCTAVMLRIFRNAILQKFREIYFDAVRQFTHSPCTFPHRTHDWRQTTGVGGTICTSNNNHHNTAYREATKWTQAGCSLIEHCWKWALAHLR